MQTSHHSLIEDLQGTSTETVPSCILGCNGEVRRDMQWEEWLGLCPPYEVKRCMVCGIRWLSPRPDNPALQIIYSSRHYFHSGGVTDYLQYAEQRSGHFRKRIARLQSLGIRSVLDYGAATGDFVAAASDAGLDATGIELSRAAREEALAKHGIALLSPEEGAALDRQFDAIHMNHVLEHMPDPIKHLQWCLQRLRPGGMLVAEVPRQFDNDADRLRRLVGRGGKQQTLDAFSLHHTYFFTPGTLRRCCELAGFEVDSLETLITPNPAIRSATRRAVEKILAWSAKTRLGGDVIVIHAIKPVQRPVATGT